MPRPRARLRALVVILAASCGSNGGNGGQQAACKAGLPTSDACTTASAPSYATQIAPLVHDRCLSCHFAGNPNSSVVLETQAEMRQEVGLIETQVYRCAMPPPGEETPLSDSERAEFLQWLVCGAPNN